MVKLWITILLGSSFILSCSNNDRQNKSAIVKDTIPLIAKPKANDTISTVSYFKIDRNAVTVLPFNIEVSLSQKAKDKIVNNKETIIINVSLTGIPKDTTLYSEDGQFYVASAEKEITYGQVARFDNIQFSKKIYDQLTNKNVDVTVYFYSGRKSSKDNLLTGDLLSDRISNIVNKEFILKGKLIYGDN